MNLPVSSISHRNFKVIYTLFFDILRQLIVPSQEVLDDICYQALFYWQGLSTKVFDSEELIILFSIWEPWDLIKSRNQLSSAIAMENIGEIIISVPKNIKKLLCNKPYLFVSLSEIHIRNKINMYFH